MGKRLSVLVVGSGAREHALVHALLRSPSTERVIAAPGNAGIAQLVSCIAVPVSDTEGLVQLAQRERVDLVVVGPELPLVNGLADALRNAGVKVFGPGSAGARLEGSKVFAKQFMDRHGIPTAAFAVFNDPDAADRYVRNANRPLVVKAEGLAAGKGVVVASDTGEALAAIDAMMRQRVFGAAGERVVIEERLAGEEISFHVVTDGRIGIDLGAAQDHKRIGEGDTGPNTGGMGAYAPIPALSERVAKLIRDEIVQPTLAGLTTDGIALRGVLFFGLMLHKDRPHVLEYNVRFGDPECAVLLARLESDVGALLDAAASGDLSDASATVGHRAAVAVVMAAAGYPGTPRADTPISGLESAAQVSGVNVFHAGTRQAESGIVTAGGRVLAITAVGTTVDAAAQNAYAAVNCIRFDGAQFRRDIASRARNQGHTTQRQS